MPGSLATPASDLPLGDAQAAQEHSPLDASRWVALALGAWPLALIALVAFVSRLRYVASYDGSYGSGDAHLVLTRALFISHGQLDPPSTLGAASGVFTNPPLIPLLLAGFAKITTVSIEHAPLVIGPVVAIAGLFALYGVLCRGFDRTVALTSVLLVALLPRFAFDSTEPDKVVYVVSFFVIALFFLYEGQRRPALFLAAGLFMGLSIFSYTTAVLFLPVYLLSHVVLARGGIKRTFDKYFLASCAIVAVFVWAYLLLDDHYHPTVVYTGSSITAALPTATAGSAPAPMAQTPPDTLAPESSGRRFVPGQVEEYWVNLRGLAKRGFRDSAWADYADGIRDQALDPVFAMGIAGFAIASWIAIARRRMEIVPLLLWMALVTVGFAIQRPAPSHFTRYPSYVTPVYVVMAVSGAIWLARAVASRFEMQPAYGIALAAPFLAYAAFSYATAPEPGIRVLYEPHHQLAEYVNKNRLLSDDARLLYLGWPSYTFRLLDGGTDAAHLQTFGWQQVSLAGYDFEGHNIRYYAYDDHNDDYFGSGKKMLGEIAQAHNFRVVETYCMGPAQRDGVTECVGHVTLFEITPKPVP